MRKICAIVSMIVSLMVLFENMKLVAADR